MMSFSEFMEKWLPHREPVLEMQHDGGRMALSILHGSVVHLGPSGLRQWAKLLDQAADQIEHAPDRVASSVRLVPRW